MSFVLEGEVTLQDKKSGAKLVTKKKKYIIIILAIIVLVGFFALVFNVNESLRKSIEEKIENFINNFEISLFSEGSDEAEPQLVLTKTAMKDGEEISSIVYDSDAEVQTFTYRLKLENVVENSNPSIITDTQTVTDILPEGITVYGDLPDGVTITTVEVDGVSRQKITWTVSNIGYGENAKYVDIIVSVSVDVFKNQEVDLETETTILDIQLSTGDQTLRKFK